MIQIIFDISIGKKETLEEVMFKDILLDFWIHQYPIIICEKFNWKILIVIFWLRLKIYS